MLSLLLCLSFLQLRNPSAHGGLRLSNLGRECLRRFFLAPYKLSLLHTDLLRAFGRHLPESAAALLIGLAVGGVARILDPSKAELEFLSFDPEIFFFLLLPPIIFDAGYTCRIAFECGQFCGGVHFCAGGIGQMV